MGMVFPVSTHNYELRYWLAAGGLNPGYYTAGDVGGTVAADVQLSVTPPPQMPATLEAGTIDGYCVGEPWNQAAVQKKIGVPVITDDEIWHDNPEKVFGLRKDFAEKYPATTAAILRALIKAQQWLDADDGANRAEAVKILSQSNYVGADPEVIAASMTGKFTFEPGDTRAAKGFNIFFDKYAGYPFYSDAVWYLTQMRRWGQIADDKTDQWYFDTAKAVYRPDLYLAAAKKLVGGWRDPIGCSARDRWLPRPARRLHRRRDLRRQGTQRLSRQIQDRPQAGPAGHRLGRQRQLMSEGLNRSSTMATAFADMEQGEPGLAEPTRPPISGDTAKVERRGEGSGQAEDQPGCRKDRGLGPVACRTADRNCRFPRALGGARAASRYLAGRAARTGRKSPNRASRSMTNGPPPRRPRRNSTPSRTPATQQRSLLAIRARFASSNMPGRRRSSTRCSLR